MKQVFLIISAVILALVLRLVLATAIYSGDVNNHIAWSAAILKFGSLNAYDRQYVGVMQPTYPPLALYSFVTSYWAYQSSFSLSRTLNNLIPVFPSGIIWWFENQNVLPAFHKITSIMSDIGIGVLIYLFAGRVFRADSAGSLIAMCMYLFNPAVFYNSTLWGQLESIPLFWLLLAVWLILKNRPVTGHLAFMAALLFKQSSLIFLPAFLLFSFYKTGWRKTLVGVIAQVLFFYLAFLPFFNLKPATIFYPLTTYYARLQTGSGSDYISDHAFNLWALTTHLAKVSDNKIIIFHLTASQVGQSAFIVICGLLLLRYLFNRKTPQLISLLGLLGFTAFMVLTRMHERYLAPVLPFMAIAASRHKELWPIFILVSVCHIINLYHMWWFPDIPVLVPLVSQWAVIVGVIVILTVSWISWMAVYFNDDRH